MPLQLEIARINIILLMLSGQYFYSWGEPLVQLPGRDFTQHWSGLHGPFSPSLSASDERTPRTSLPNVGKNPYKNTIEILNFFLTKIIL